MIQIHWELPIDYAYRFDIAMEEADFMDTFYGFEYL